MKLYHEQKIIADLVIKIVRRQKISAFNIPLGCGRHVIAANVSQRIKRIKQFKDKTICWLAVPLYLEYLRRVVPDNITVTANQVEASKHDIIISFFQKQLKFTPKEYLIVLGLF